ncbi:MAG: 3'(2'),5'-bisphosphate nucleotidase CysQ [Micropepsaceae bacterium]
MSRTELTAKLVSIAREAGDVLMKHYSGDIVQRKKADNSPVTAADEEAEALILRRLGEVAPAIPVVAEESAAAGRLPNIGTSPFFLVDPLDGTKEFLNHNGEFTVNIALIEHGIPVAGVVFAPAIGRMFWGADIQAFEENSAATKPIRTRTAPETGLTAIASRSHRDAATDEFLSRHRIASIVSAGSSLKFCVLAAGEADIYPRMGPTMEWDTAAGHAVLRAAGGRVTLVDTTTDLTYGNAESGFRNPFFIAWGR